MQIRVSLFSVAAIVLFLVLTASPAAAEPSSAAASSGQTPAPAEKSEPTAKPAPKAAPKKAAKLPCARAKWKDDPVCFGANDPFALPVPSARALGKSEPNAETRRGDIAIVPKTRFNQSSNMLGYGSRPNAAFGGGMGGGVGLVFHF